MPGDAGALKFGFREIIPLGTMLVAIVLAYAGLKSDLQSIARDIGNQDRRLTVAEGRIDALDNRILAARPDPYHGADAARDFLQRDKIIDNHEQRIESLERLGHLMRPQP